MKFDEVGTTLKHLETINGNVKNLSKRIKGSSRYKHNRVGLVWYRTDRVEVRLSRFGTKLAI
jgi:hypothetical protein